MMNKPNCSKCTYAEPLEPGVEGYAFCSTLHITVTHEGKNTINETGCLFNPVAREFLMKDVIEELERCMQPGHSLWAHYSPNEILELIKNGVKK